MTAPIVTHGKRIPKDITEQDRWYDEYQTLLDRGPDGNGPLPRVEGQLWARLAEGPR